MALKSIKHLDSGGFGNVDLVEDENKKQYARKTFSVNQSLPKELEQNVKRL